MTWVFSLGGIHLNNMSGRQAAGGDPRSWLTTPFAVLEDWGGPTVAKPIPLWQGGPPLANGQRPLSQAYENVEESIPFSVVGRDADEAAQALQALKLALAGATKTTPVVWRHRPRGASNELYAEVFAGWVQERTVDGELSAVEGWPTVEGVINLTRSPFFGSDSVIPVLASQSVTNGASGNVFSLGEVFGDLAREGQPLNVRLAKPAGSTAVSVILATVASRTNLAIASTLSAITNTTTGSAFAVSSSFNVSALRRLSGVSLRLLARLATLTSPSKAEINAEVQTAGGTKLWESGWVGLSTDTSGQLIDLGTAPLSMLRLPLPTTTAANVKVAVSLRSTDGTAVTATLDYVDALLAYDVCVVESAGLASGEVLAAYGAQNLSGGGWLPLFSEVASVLDGSNVQTKPARIRGQLVRAFTSSSLYVAWLGSGKSHVKTDTTTISVDHTPLWRSLRGVT